MHDVIIIGAGFAGLSAATELARRGRDVLVLESRNRVGGRVEAQLNGLGERIDTGGQFVCDDMSEVMALLRARGHRLVETRFDGVDVAQPPLSTSELGAVYRGSMAIRERMNAISPRDPAIAGLSVAAWVETLPDTAAAKAAFRSMIEGLWCLPLDELPLWHLIDNDRRITNEQSELQYFLRETMHALAEDLAATLGHALRLGAPARRVEHGPDGVRIVADGLTVEAREAVLALPLSRTAMLDYAPALPPKLAKALSVWRGGDVVKLKLRYARPFWRDGGLSGMVMWRDLHGLFACDSSPDDGHAALTVFAGGPLGAQWVGQGEDWLVAAILDRLTAALGPDAGKPLDIATAVWTGGDWDDGGYGDLVLDVNARDAEAILLAGHPPLHFASSDIAPSFPGYVEGAIVAGRAAAAKILAAR